MIVSIGPFSVFLILKANRKIEMDFSNSNKIRQRCAGQQLLH